MCFRIAIPFSGFGLPVGDFSVYHVLLWALSDLRAHSLTDHHDRVIEHGCTGWKLQASARRPVCHHVIFEIGFTNGVGGQGDRIDPAGDMCGSQSGVVMAANGPPSTASNVSSFLVRNFQPRTQRSCMLSQYENLSLIEVPE